jgi:hypothetical protein
MGLCRIILVAGLLVPPVFASAQSGVQVPRIYRDCAAEARAARARGDGDIVVCGDREVRSPYRIPAPKEGFDPAGPIASVSRERHRLYEVGDSGIHSCSTVGPGGYTGCAFKTWKNAREQYGK